MARRYRYHGRPLSCSRPAMKFEDRPHPIRFRDRWGSAKWGSMAPLDASRAARILRSTPLGHFRLALPIAAHSCVFLYRGFDWPVPIAFEPISTLSRDRHRATRGGSPSADKPFVRVDGLTLYDPRGRAKRFARTAWPDVPGDGVRGLDEWDADASIGRAR